MGPLLSTSVGVAYTNYRKGLLLSTSEGVGYNSTSLAQQISHGDAGFYSVAGTGNFVVLGRLRQMTDDHQAHSFHWM